MKRKMRYYSLIDSPGHEKSGEDFAREERYEIWKSGGVYSNGSTPSNDDKTARACIRECKKMGRVPILCLFYNFGVSVYCLPWN
jgi:hypothetical protein